MEEGSFSGLRSQISSLQSPTFRLDYLVVDVARRLSSQYGEDRLDMEFNSYPQTFGSRCLVILCYILSLDTIVRRWHRLVKS